MVAEDFLYFNADEPEGEETEFTFHFIILRGTNRSPTFLFPLSHHHSA